MASSIPGNVNGSYLQQAQVDPYAPTTYDNSSAAAASYAAPAAAAPPAELPASTPTPSTEPAAENVDKDEVGWLFVKQYYTTLNKTPEKLHLFYNKRSTLVWGEETEEVQLLAGRVDIQNRIASANFNNCKVRVTNVDSLASMNNGIIIQVIGEMSNDGEPNKKFAQTFFLAEQPNGYFVLNDVLRFLAPEEEQVYEEEEEGEVNEDEPVEVTLEDATVDVEVTVKETLTIEEPVEIAVNGDGEPEIVNGDDAAPAEVEAPVQEEPEPEPAPVEEEAAPAPEPEVEEQQPEPVQEPEPGPEPEPAPAPKEEKPAPPPPPAVPAAPPKPKTWANLVAGNAAPKPAPSAAAVAAAAPAAPVAQAPAAAAAATESLPPPKSESPAPGVTMPQQQSKSTSDGWTTTNSRRPQKSAEAEAQTLGYIRNVTEGFDTAALRKTLEKFGPLKQFEVVKSRNCAFVEFSTPGAFKAAAAANPHHIGDHTINVEERRSRNAGQGGPQFGGRPPYQGGRGDHRSSPSQGGGRGGFGRGERGGFERGRGGGERGRGGFRRGGQA